MEIKNRPNYIYSWNICPTIKCNLLDLHLPSRISECFQDNTFHQSNHFHLKIFINSGLNFLLLLYNYIINFLRMDEKKFQFSSVAQSCPTLCDPMDCSPPESSVHGILQARIPEQVAMSSSRGSSRPRDQTHISCVSCIGRWILYHQYHPGSPGLL